MKLIKSTLLFLAISAALLASETFSDKTVDSTALTAIFKKAAPEAALSPRLARCYYAVVRRSELITVAATVCRTLSKTYGVGIGPYSNGWNKRFDCEAFAMAYNLELRARLMRELWHSESPVIRPAAFIVCVITRNGLAHALVFVVTDQGPCWVDPVAGVVSTTPEERTSIYWLQV